MNVEKAANSFAQFLALHAGELGAITGALGAVVNALPLQHDDKAGILDTLTDLQKSATNIAAAAANLTGAPVVVRKSDVAEIVGEFLSSDAGRAILADAVAAALAVDGEPGNANGA